MQSAYLSSGYARALFSAIDSHTHINKYGYFMEYSIILCQKISQYKQPDVINVVIKYLLKAHLTIKNVITIELSIHDKILKAPSFVTLRLRPLHFNKNKGPECVIYVSTFS